MTRRPVHPGEVLRGELQETGITASDLSSMLKMPLRRIEEIIEKKQPVTADTALRLGHWFGMNAQFWMNLQAQHDLAIAEQDTGSQISRLPKLQSA